MILLRINNTPYGLVLMMGLVSLFADMAHEGARSITGPYMSVLGASGFVVSFVAGFGELLGNGLRIFSGYLTDKTKKYWPMAMAGYLINLVSVPLMGVAGGWRGVSALIFTERVGKAIRTPARDTIISYAARKVGSGYSYGLHQAMDQVGALVGPLLISIFLYFQLGYKTSFILLVIPAAIAISLLTATKNRFPHPERLVKEGAGHGKNKITKTLWTYIIAVSFVGMGTSDFPLIAYHAKKISVIGDAYIPLVYSLTILVTAGSALLFGRLFDKIGMAAVIAGVACSTTFSWFAFFGGAAGLMLGLTMWGIGMGAQESVMKAVIADLMRQEYRGTAFGIFNASYGVFSFAGSVIIGFLYDTNLSYLVYFSIASHLVAIVLLTMISGRRFY